MRRLFVVNWLLSSSWDAHTFAVPVLGFERGFDASTIGLILGAFTLAVTAVRAVIPMLAHLSEIRQTLSHIEEARQQLRSKGLNPGPVQIGAMIEVPAAALSLPLFLKHFDFLSIGTNDLIQYTLAIDRADEQVAHLYDPLHPAILRLLADTIAQGVAAGKEVAVCGEMAGDPAMTRLLLGLGLRSFSMHPTQLLRVKQEVLRADTKRLAPWAQYVMQSEDPAAEMQAR